MKKRILGIDIGIASIGWALIDLDDEAASDATLPGEGEIVGCGVRIFTEAENPKDGKPLAEPRRLARSARRRLDRRSDRLADIKQLFIKYRLIEKEQLNTVYRVEPGTLSPYTLRKEGLDRLLSGPEFARVLTQIAKRRGYKSMRLSEEKADKKSDSKKMLAAIAETRRRLIEGKYRTVGEMLVLDDKYIGAKRNKQDDYKNSIPRELLQEEIRILFSRQRELGGKFAGNDFEKEYTDISFFQNPIKIPLPGKCTFEPDEFRAPKNGYSAEKFSALTRILNLRLISMRGKGERLLVRAGANGQPHSEDIPLVGKLWALCLKNAKVTYKQVRNTLKDIELGLGEEWRFPGIDYRPKPNDPESKKAEDKTFVELKGYNDIRKTLEKADESLWTALAQDAAKLDAVAEVLSREKSDDKITQALRQEAAITDGKTINALLDVSMRGRIHLSRKALAKIIPLMEQGLRYSKACEMAGYNHSKPAGVSQALSRLPVLGKDERIRNPVVDRAISQFRKVVNAVLEKHCKAVPLDQMNIELARELSHNFGERMEIEREQNAFRERKEAARQHCLESRINPDIKDNLLKFRLLNEQNSICPYSGKPINIKQLCETGYADIDHILPYSRSLDDSLNNKVLCLADENRQKGNMIPHEYILKQNRSWDEFATRIMGMKELKDAKRKRLLKLEFSEDSAEGFRSRHLNDTRYISRFIKEYAESNLKFSDKKVIKQKVQARSGALTAFLRHQWGLLKDRQAGDKHHAVDAIVTACATQGMVSYLSTLSAMRETWQCQDKRRPHFSEPWEGFKNNVAFTVNSLFVSRAPRHKVTGAAHEDTIRRKVGSGSVTRISLTKLTPKLLENLLHKDTLNKRLHKLLKERLAQFGDKADKAFAEPVYFPKRDGGNGVIVRKVPILAEKDSGISVRGGLANNGEMVRVDVFAKGGKWFLVPIYVADMIKQELPNKAIVANKDETEWPVMDKTYEFKFTLQKNDLIAIKQKGEDEEYLGYFTGAHRGTAQIALEFHDRSNFKISTNGKLENPWHFGSKTLQHIKKYQVDALGNYHEIKSEKRLGTIPQMRKTAQKQSAAA